MREKQKPDLMLRCSPMGMGSCFGNCLKNDSRAPCTIHFNGTNVIEFDNLVDNMETSHEAEPRRSRFHGESLEVLDAKVLAARAASQFPALTRPSSPGSFVDLEWELEGVVSRVDYNSPPAMESPVGSLALQTSTMTQCSRVSSPPSLEWDLVDCELPAAAAHDQETEQLISEIERLTQRALQETGFTLL